jgi:hypothetical protein
MILDFWSIFSHNSKIIGGTLPGGDDVLSHFEIPDPSRRVTVGETVMTGAARGP